MLIDGHSKKLNFSLKSPIAIGKKEVFGNINQDLVLNCFHTSPNTGCFSCQ